NYWATLRQATKAFIFIHEQTQILRFRKVRKKMSLFDCSYPEAENIFVGTMSEARAAAAMFDGIITIEDVGNPYPVRIDPSPKVEQLVLAFDDIESQAGGGLAATLEHVQAALQFGRKYREGMLFIHCHAGQCRSPAIALAIIADRMGPGRETEAVDALKVVRRWSTRYGWVVELADRALDRDGVLVKALEEKGNKLTRIGSVDLLKGSADLKGVRRSLLNSD